MSDSGLGESLLARERPTRRRFTKVGAVATSAVLIALVATCVVLVMDREGVANGPAPSSSVGAKATASETGRPSSSRKSKNDIVDEVRSKLGPVKHVVVLMMENRSFDHMLGLLKKDNPDIDGCLPGDNGDENPCFNVDSDGNKIYVTPGAEYFPDRDGPDHSCKGTLGQIFGDAPANSSEPTMTGFVKSYEGVLHGDGSPLMQAFSPEQVPAISTLAKEFALFDGWFPGMPGPTMPNRMFALSGSSDGAIQSEDIPHIVGGYSQKMILETLDENNSTWRIYFEDVPATLIHRYPRHPKNWKKFRPFAEFYVDAMLGRLPDFTWLEPRYFDGKYFNANDQHPGHDVALGDHLIANVYNALRNGDTVLVVTYDEHGGFFDHIGPPKAPNPDGIIDKTVPFGFDRVGVRVPTIVVSPRVKKQVVKRPPRNGPQFEHSSIPATLRKMFAPDADFLTKRDAWAKTFDFLWEDATEFREDCPVLLPYVKSHRKAPGSPLPIGDEIGSYPMSDLQAELVDLAWTLTKGDGSPRPSRDMTEREASQYVANRIKSFFRRR